MISDTEHEPKTPAKPRAAVVTADGPQHAHHHQAEVQILSANGNTIPLQLALGSTLNITTGKREEVVKSTSYLQHVPKLSLIADRSYRKLTATGQRDPRYLRSTVTVDRGRIR